MFDASVLKFQGLFKQLIPLGCLFLAVILDRSGVLGFLPIHPFLSFSTIYYWSLYRPDWISLVGLMVIGVMDDSLSGAYLGQSAMLFLLIYAVVLKLMDYFKTAAFLATWGVFALIMGACGCIQWGISALLCHQPINLLVLCMQNATTVLMFPFVYLLLNRIAAYTYDWE